MSANNPRLQWLYTLSQSAHNPPPSLKTASDDQLMHAVNYVNSILQSGSGGYNMSRLAVAKSVLHAEYLSRGETLRRASQTLFDTVNSKGSAECPCCQRKLSKYWVMLNGGMAAALMWMINNSGDGGWVHMPSAPKDIARATYPALAHWGFAEKQPNSDDASTFSSGVWRATPQGKQFVLGNVSAPRKKQVLNGSVVGESSDAVKFADVLNTSFDKSEVYDA